MRILHLITNLNKGGAQRLVIDICNEIHNNTNHEVLLLVLSQGNDFKNICNNIKILHIEIDISISVLRKTKIYKRQYEEVLDDFEPHVVHSHLYFSEIIAHESVRSSIKYVTHCHDNMSQFKKFSAFKIFSKKDIIRNYEKFRLLSKYKRAGKVFLTISNDTFSFFKEVLPNKYTDNIVKILNSIDRKRFINKNYSKKIKFKNKIKLINIGTFLTKKNQIFLVDVVNYIVNKNYNVHLDLIGDGVTKSKIIDQIKKYELESNISLHGFVDDVEKYLWSSDIYVHSATYEPFGLVLIEAMTAGLPIVCINGRGNSDIIDNNKNGFIINSIDPKIFGDQIIKLYNEENLYDKITKEGMIFSEKFDINKYVKKLIELY